MDEAALREAFQHTDYLVCLNEADWAVIRIDQPLPAALQARVGDHAWGFLTAWNPRASTALAADNLAAQRHLLAALRALPMLVALHPAIGVGANGWYEPSLFVIGPDTNRLDALANHHEQAAYVHGRGNAVARLRWLTHRRAGP